MNSNNYNNGNSNNNNVIWQDPPALVRSKTNRNQIMNALDELKNQPNRWGIIYQGKRTSVMSLKHRIRHQKNYQSLATNGTFDTTTRSNKSDENSENATLYARFIPYQ